MSTPNGFWGDPDGYGDVSYSTASNSFMASTAPPATAATYVPLTEQPTGSYTPPRIMPPAASQPFAQSFQPAQAFQPPPSSQAASQAASRYESTRPPQPMTAQPATGLPSTAGVPASTPSTPQALGALPPAPFAGRPFAAQPFAAQPAASPAVLATGDFSAPDSEPLVTLSPAPSDTPDPLSLTSDTPAQFDEAELYGPSSFGVLTNPTAAMTATNAMQHRSTIVGDVAPAPPTAFIPAAPAVAHAAPTTTFSPTSQYESAPQAESAPEAAVATAAPAIREDSKRRGTARGSERGLPGVVAFAILIVVSGVGGVFDMRNGAQVKGSFGIALIAGSLLAILCVKRSSMFSIVVAPPLVYFGAAATVLYARSDGLSNRNALINGAINWLVYGFPAIAGATAAVLIVAGVRMIIRK